MRKISFVFLLLIIAGCSRPDSGGKDDGSNTNCPKVANTTLFDENDYFTTAGVRPDIMNQDYLAIYQWHLHNRGQKVGSTKLPVAGYDLNVLPVWNSYKGKNITIGIVDSGVDSNHPDLKPSLDLTKSWNYKTGKNDPSPLDITSECGHGTAVAGIAAAKGFNGGIGVMGVAPEAKIVGLNVGLGCGKFNAPSGDYIDALGRDVDISSNSWGCLKENLECVSQSEIDAIKDGVVNGRGGKGRIYIFAAGNDRQYSVDSNYQSGTNGFEVISVAAADADGKMSGYSSTGSNILVTAFGGSDPFIVTTDMTGCDKGFDNDSRYIMPHRLNSNGEYTHMMNGTSAATPMVAGVVALMLEARPTLSWRDVRYILATTTSHKSADVVKNGAGHYFSHASGFGLVDANAAVNKAKTFVSLSDLKTSNHNQPLKELRSDWNFEKTIDISTTNSVKKIEYVNLTLDISGTPPSDLKIELTSPKGMVAILSDGNFAFPTGFFNGGHTFGSNAFLDESSSGTWRLRVESDESKKATLESWTLEFKGRTW